MLKDCRTPSSSSTTRIVAFFSIPFLHLFVLRQLYGMFPAVPVGSRLIGSCQKEHTKTYSCPDDVPRRKANLSDCANCMPSLPPYPAFKTSICPQRQSNLLTWFYFLLNSPGKNLGKTLEYSILHTHPGPCVKESVKNMHKKMCTLWKFLCNLPHFNDIFPMYPMKTGVYIWFSQYIEEY